MTEGEDLVARAGLHIGTLEQGRAIATRATAARRSVLPLWRTYTRLEDRWRAELRRLESQLAMTVRAIEPTITVTSRLKSFPSTWRKVLSRDTSLDALHDVLGLRVLVNRDPACYEVLAALLVSSPDATLRVRDYIAHPKPNGYRSIHVVLRPAEGPTFEVQIRSRRMQEESEHGPAAHWRYKRSSEELSLRALSPRGTGPTAASLVAATPMFA